MDARFTRFAIAAGTVPLLLAGCGAPSPGSAEPERSASSDPVADCPSAAPAGVAKADVVFHGDAGRAQIVAPTPTTAPRVAITTPFRVDRTQVLRVHGGHGPALADNAVVTVCYQGVNGRTGDVFDDSFVRSTSAEFALTDVVPGFRKTVAGQQVGATVVSAVTGADAYPSGQAAAGIEPGDTLVFTVVVLSAS